VPVATASSWRALKDANRLMAFLYASRYDARLRNCGGKIIAGADVVDIRDLAPLLGVLALC